MIYLERRSDFEGFGPEGGIPGLATSVDATLQSRGGYLSLTDLANECFIRIWRTEIGRLAGGHGWFKGII